MRALTVAVPEQDFRDVLVRNPGNTGSVGQDWGWVPSGCFDFTGYYIEYPTS